MDLMLTACRQNSTTCNGTAAITTIATINPASAATASIRTIATAFTGTTDKCTFVHTSLIGAPTFKIEKSGTNYLASKYDVHYAEYTNDSWNQPGLENGVPLINNAWANLKARRYNIAA